MDVETICAGLLHDCAEDTHLSLEEIEEIFGEGVRQIVEGETKVSKLAKLGSSPVDYEETQAENLRSFLFLAMTNDYRVIFVKLVCFVCVCVCGCMYMFVCFCMYYV